MNVEQYERVSEFMAATRSFFNQNEVDSIDFYSYCIRIQRQFVSNGESSLFFKVADQGTIVLVAAAAPPHPLRLLAFRHRKIHRAMCALVDHLMRMDYALSGVFAAQRLAASFVKKWRQTSRMSIENKPTYRRGASIRVWKRTGLWKLNKKTFFTIHSSEGKQASSKRLNGEHLGHPFLLNKQGKYGDRDVCWSFESGWLRLGTTADISLVIQWMSDHYAEVGAVVSLDQLQHIVTTRMGRQEVYIWEDKQDRKARSMVCIQRSTQHCVGLEMVYTPPADRGNKYATHCLLSVCELLFFEAELCWLFSERPPGSNNVYERIGFERHDEYHYYKL